MKQQKPLPRGLQAELKGNPGIHWWNLWDIEEDWITAMLIHHLAINTQLICQRFPELQLQPDADAILNLHNPNKSNETMKLMLTELEEEMESLRTNGPHNTQLNALTHLTQPANEIALHQ